MTMQPPPLQPHELICGPSRTAWKFDSFICLTRMVMPALLRLQEEIRNGVTALGAEEYAPLAPRCAMLLCRAAWCACESR